MHIIIDRLKLETALEVVSKFMDARPIGSILENTVITAEKDNTVTVRAGNSDTQAVVIIKEGAECKVPGMYLLPGKPLYDSVKEMPEGNIEIKVREDGKAVDMTWPNGGCTFPCYTDEYPATRDPEEADATEFTTSASVLLRGLSGTIYAVSKDDLRPQLETIFIENDDTLQFTGTNGRLLAHSGTPDGNKHKKGTLLMPMYVADKLTKILPDDETPVTVRADKKRIAVMTEDLTVSTFNQTANYPNYKSVFPKEFTTNITVAKDALTKAIKCILPYSATRSVIIKTEPGKLNLAGENNDTKAKIKETLKAQATGEHVQTAFNGDSLLETIKNIKGDSVFIKLNGPSQAALVSGSEEDGFEEKTVIMPVMTT